MQTLQNSMDAFIRDVAAGSGVNADTLLHSEQCMEGLAQYLLHFSDLFQDPEMSDHADYADWEEGLEAHMSELLQGDVEPVADLGDLPLNALDSEHIRDFLAWFLLRESGDAGLMTAYVEVLRRWFDFLLQQQWWKQDEYFSFLQILNDVGPAAIRAARLSQVLFHFVRSGTGVPPRLRGQRFSRFVEGHGRVCAQSEAGLHFNFENQGETVGPVLLPGVILDMIEPGDVFDVELGLRGDSWVIVDIGPVYPRCVYIEVEEYQGLEKLS